MLLKRPWRWLVSILGAVLLVGLAFQAGQALGAPEYLGLPTIARFVLFVGVACGLSLFVVPSYESMDRGEPLPPLPVGMRLPASRPPSDRAPRAMSESLRGERDPQASELRAQRDA